MQGKDGAVDKKYLEEKQKMDITSKKIVDGMNKDKRIYEAILSAIDSYLKILLYTLALKSPFINCEEQSELYRKIRNHELNIKKRLSFASSEYKRLTGEYMIDTKLPYDQVILRRRLENIIYPIFQLLLDKALRDRII